ncbi:MAG: radical SAM protein [Nanobdellota archaeon]
MEENELRTSVLQLAITEGCDSACVYCDFWKIEDPDYLRMQDLDKLFSVIDFDGIDLLCVTGGEPTEHPHIQDMIHHISETTNTNVLLSSNCLNYERLESIVKNAGDVIHTISTSLDGEQEVHDRNRGVKGAYSNVMKSKQLAEENNIRMKFATTVLNTNVNDLPKLLYSIGDGNLDVKTANLSSAYYGNNRGKEALKRQKETVADKFYNILKNYYVENDVENLFTFYNGIYVKHGVRPMCTVGLNEFFVLPNADIFACYSKDKLTNFRETTRQELDTLRRNFYEDHAYCNDCFARCSSGNVVFVQKEFYQDIANEIIHRWRKGETFPEKDYFSIIKNPFK